MITPKDDPGSMEAQIATLTTQVADMQVAMSAMGITATRMTAVLGAGGTVTLAHGRPTAPTIVPVSRFVTDQLFMAVVGAITATQVTLTGKRSRGTLLLTSGPFESAAAGDTVEVLVIGK